LKENVVTYSIQSSGQASETLTQLLGKADTVIDRVLPDETEESVVTGSSSGLRQTTTLLTKKVASRLRKRAFQVCQYSTARTQEIVHIDLIAYARETFGADETKIASVFDRVIAALPTPDASKNFASSLTQNSPAAIRPYVQRGTEVVSPAVDFGFASLSSLLLSFRRKFAGPSRLPACTPLAVATPLLEAKNDPNETHEQQQVTLEATVEVIPTHTDDHNTDEAPIACKQGDLPKCLDTCLPSCSSPVLEPVQDNTQAAHDETRAAKKRQNKKNKADTNSQ
jgi:hypothetical protein